MISLFQQRSLRQVSCSRLYIYGSIAQVTSQEQDYKRCEGVMLNFPDSLLVGILVCFRVSIAGEEFLAVSRSMRVETQMSK